MVCSAKYLVTYCWPLKCKRNKMGAEKERIKDNAWKKWGPYVSERQWGTVREDYSASGDAWNYVTHDAARSRAYRRGEDGLAGLARWTPRSALRCSVCRKSAVPTAPGRRATPGCRSTRATKQ